MPNETITPELTSEMLALKQKRAAEQQALNNLPEDESDGPNVCISCQ
jgi:hypothetical protein